MKWTEKTVKECLTRNGNTVKGKQIMALRAGIKVWGAIDFLCSKHSYRWFK